MDFSVMNKIMMYFHGDTYILLASLSCKFLAIAGDNDDDAWAGARQLSGKREPAPGTRSQVRQGWDKILSPGSGSPTGMAALTPPLSLTRLWQHRTHSPATAATSRSGSVSASSDPPPHHTPLLRLREMSASGPGGSGATQPEPLQSLLSLSSELRASSSALLTLLVAGT